MRRTLGVRAGLAASAAAAIGLGALAIPAGAGSAPQLPGVSAEELVASVITASPPAFGGTVQVVNGLGLPTLPGSEGSEHTPLGAIPDTARVWFDGDGRGRIALPSNTGEQTLVEDGETLWHYDSESRTVTALEHGELPSRAPLADPAAAARTLIDTVRSTSQVWVDGTGEVAGRPAYDLVLTPAPTERTLLREVRVAVDSVTRLPLRLDVLTKGSTEPALRISFTHIDVGPQDADLFRFIPPDGVTVERAERPDGWVSYAPLS
ncbi:MAG: outer membrane lipoprotein carrier protein LolA, partial [Actinomycetota bacterium]|nr:outer membrane lipoprotein carrier protein LolA [Actinomycetota bacterium]